MPDVFEYVENPEATKRVLVDVFRERLRQLERWGRQTHPDNTGAQKKYLNSGRTNASVASALKAFNDKHDNPYWSHILLEEVYEAMEEADTQRLRKELIEVAAVAVAWVEDIDGFRSTEK